MRKWTAKRLRRLADRIDHAGAPKRTSWSFTFESGKGIQFNQDGRGCPVWYLGDADYDRAHEEAAAESRSGTWAQDVADGQPTWAVGSVVHIRDLI